MNLYEALGPLALSSRMKLLSESLAKDVGNIYQKLGISFEPRWFTLFWILRRQQPLPITELARELRQTHAAIVQITNLLEKKGLINSSKDKRDERRRQVSLSAKGEKLFEEVEPVLAAIEQANKDLLYLAAPDLLSNLLSIEQALEQRPMYDRVMDNLHLMDQGFAIKSYSEQFKDAFSRLNREWIEEHFGQLEDVDLQVLQHPEEEIIRKGGMIFFALHRKEVLGTAAVQEEAPGIFRLSRFAVQQDYRGKGIGRALLEKCRAFAISGGAHTLMLYTSPLLVNSLNFYAKNGFTFAPMSKHDHKRFKRASIRMEMPLHAVS